MVLKFKPENAGKQVLKFDKRKTYTNHNIHDIAYFLFDNYANHIKTIRNAQARKLNSLKQLNKRLVEKKQYYRGLLNSLSYNSRTIEETFIFIVQISQNVTYEQAKEEYEKQKSDYYRINFILQNINQDIQKLNEIKKSLKKEFDYYNSINLTYDFRAKITLYDIGKLQDGKITQNIQNCFYFYFSQLKKEQDKSLTHEDIKPLFPSLFSDHDLNKLIRESEKKSYREFRKKSIIPRCESLESTIINKWV